MSSSRSRSARPVLVYCQRELFNYSSNCTQRGRQIILYFYSRRDKETLTKEKGETKEKADHVTDHVTATKKNIPFDKPFIQLFELASVDIEQLSFQSDIPSHIEH
jgi:hypothetical protein